MCLPATSKTTTVLAKQCIQRDFAGPIGCVADIYLPALSARSAAADLLQVTGTAAFRARAPGISLSMTWLSFGSSMCARDGTQVVGTQGLYRTSTASNMAHACHWSHWPCRTRRQGCGRRPRPPDQLLHDGLQQLRGYQADGGPFPERLHLIMLFSRFCFDHLVLLRDWTALARREVASWPTTRNLGVTDGTRQILNELLRQGDQLTSDLGHLPTGRRAPGSPPQQAPRADGEGPPASLPA